MCFSLFRSSLSSFIISSYRVQATFKICSTCQSTHRQSGIDHRGTCNVITLRNPPLEARQYHVQAMSQRSLTCPSAHALPIRHRSQDCECSSEVLQLFLSSAFVPSTGQIQEDFDLTVHAQHIRHPSDEHLRAATVHRPMLLCPRAVYMQHPLRFCPSILRKQQMK